MILVFFLCFLLVFTIYILNTRIEVYIDKKSILNEKDYKIIVKLCKFKISLLKVELNKEKLKRIVRESIAGKQKKFKSEDTKKIRKKIKEADIKLEKIDINLKIGIDDCAITAYLVGIISSIISHIIRYLYNPRNDLKNYKYKVMPVYNKNYANLTINCIISAKMVHIIYVIFLIKKGSKKNNERTSDRKPYEYSYE